MCSLIHNILIIFTGGNILDVVVLVVVFLVLFFVTAEIYLFDHIIIIMNVVL